MRISDNYSYLDPTSLRPGASAKAKNVSSGTAPTPDGDVAQGVIAQAAAQRADKIAQLQQQVRSGQYQVNDRAVSSRLVDAHLA